MSEIPELPQDILNYLGNLIKPKKYTLINKFCRDLYFRKNGVTIRFARKYPSYDLLTKYRVKILRSFSAGIYKDIKQEIGEVEQFAENVISIKTDCSGKGYKLLVGLFPNLEEFKGTIKDDVGNKNILTCRKVPGVIVSISNEDNIDAINKLIELGYNFSTDDTFERLNLQKNNVVILDLVKTEMNIDLYPNLKKIHILCGGQDDTKQIILKAKKHPKVKKIISTSLRICDSVKKDNGDWICIKYRGYVHQDSIYVKDIYDRIKCDAPGLAVYTAYNLERIINLEKSSKIKNRPKLRIENDPHIQDLDELVNLFRVEIVTSIDTITKYYLIKYAFEKITNIDGNTAIICRTKTGKFSLYQYNDLEF